MLFLAGLVPLLCNASSCARVTISSSQVIVPSSWCIPLAAAHDQSQRIFDQCVYPAETGEASESFSAILQDLPGVKPCLTAPASHVDPACLVVYSHCQSVSLIDGGTR